jgi:hypothetical protein
MKKITMILALVLSICFTASFTHGAKAQTEAPQIVDTTMSVDANIRAAVEAWLGTNAPVPLPYWAITSVSPQYDGEIVSIVALNIETPGEEWHFIDTNDIAYMGSVFVDSALNVIKHSRDPETDVSLSIMKLALPVLQPVEGAGGGSNVSFPWKSGGAMMYGPNGVHVFGDSGGAGVGFGAVDFVGGDDWGSGIAPANAYAVFDGVIDYVCQGSEAVTVRTHDAATNSYYIYGHLIDNANLVEGTSFRKGNLLGALKYGSYSDDCGQTKQTDRHYHLHFGFIPLAPATSGFRMENCILNIGNSKWNCGTKTISPGEFLVGGGGVSGGDDGTGMAIAQPSFWDYVVVGAVDIWNRTVVDNMPDHTTIEYTYVIYSSAKLAIRMARVLVHSNVNLGPLITVFLLGMSFKLLFGIAEFIVFLFKAWKSLVPILGA